MFEQAVYAKAYNQSAGTAGGYSSSAKSDAKDTGVYPRLDTASAEVLDTMVAQVSNCFAFEVLQDAMDR